MPKRPTVPKGVPALPPPSADVRTAILADDMGLGRTRQAIIAIPEAAPAGPWLVTRSRGPKDRTPLLASLSKARQRLAAAKAATTTEYVEGAVAQGEKVIVFSGVDEPTRTIAAHFGAAAVLLTGATPASRRGSAPSYPLVPFLGCRSPPRTRRRSCPAATRPVWCRASVHHHHRVRLPCSAAHQHDAQVRSDTSRRTDCARLHGG